jgi:twinkle protein
MAQMIHDDDIDFSQWEEETDAHQQVRSARHYVQQNIDRARSPQREVHHFMPWGKTHRLIQFRPGEVTIWGGENGSGKSLVTGQVALSLCAQDQPTCIASFEMKPVKTLERMGRQWTKHRTNDPEVMGSSVEFETLMDLYAQFRDWTDNKLWLYDRQGTVHWKQVCAVARYCAKELGITQFFIDNLMKCVAGEDDYNGQKMFVDELCAIARDHNIHIHLVCHVKKPSKGEDHYPTKYDVKGSGAITDQPDNVILVWRNKKKEHAKGSERALVETKPDTVLVVDKQRNGEGWEGKIGLFYLQQSQQYVASHKAWPMDFYRAPELEEADE